MSDPNKVFQAFGDHFFATRGRPRREAMEDLHSAMDEIAFGDAKPQEGKAIDHDNEEA